VRRVTLLVLLAALLVPSASASRSASKTALAHKLGLALSAPGLEPSRTAAYAVDLRTG